MSIEHIGTESALLDALAETISQEETKPYEWTKKDFMEKTGLSEGQTRRRLSKMVASGEIKRREAMIGRITIVYWFAAEEPK
jgi:DNA-binding Lrp family transcriptional regulator